MLKNKSIALHLGSYSPAGLVVFANIVYKRMSTSAIYTSPNPSLVDQALAIDALRTALSKWGCRSNHGSSVAYTQVQDTAEVVRENLRKLKAYCENQTLNNESAWLSVGFAAKKPRKKGKVSQAVNNLHQSSRRVNRFDHIKMSWSKAYGASKYIRIMYKVMRSDDSSFANAKLLAVVSKTSYIDNLKGLPHKPHYYYWIIPVNASRDGLISNPCIGYATRLV